MKPITPSLWFDRQAEDAATFYTSIFPHSSIDKVTHYGAEGFEVHGMPEGTVFIVTFTLNNQPFLAFNAGPAFKFNEAVSFIIPCEDQAEVDYYWEKLTADGGSEQPCGWVKDKFGVSWQVTPTRLDELMSDPDPKKAGAAMNAMLKMSKIDIATIEAAVAVA